MNYAQLIAEHRAFYARKRRERAAFRAFMGLSVGQLLSLYETPL